MGRFTARRTAVGGDGAETFSSGRDCPMIGLSHAVSGSDWSPMGVVANPYVKKIRASELIAEWRRQGLSEDAIIERARQDDLLGSTLAPVDVPGIISLVDKGASRDDVVKLAAVLILGKATSGAKGTGEAVIQVPGRVQSRINIASGRTEMTPLRDNGNPVSAGFDHVIDGHFNREISNSRSVFTIAPDELKGILQSRSVVKSPVTALPDGQFVRTVDVGRAIGTTTLKDGGAPTSVIRVFTDKAGNLITAFPVKAGN